MKGAASPYPSRAFPLFQGTPARWRFQDLLSQSQGEAQRNCPFRNEPFLRRPIRKPGKRPLRRFGVQRLLWFQQAYPQGVAGEELLQGGQRFRLSPPPSCRGACQDRSARRRKPPPTPMRCGGAWGDTQAGYCQAPPGSPHRGVLRQRSTVSASSIPLRSVPRQRVSALSDGRWSTGKAPIRRRRGRLQISVHGR